MTRRRRWNEMDPRQRRAWWLGFAALYAVAAVVLAALGVILPALVCAVVGAGLAAAGLREGTGNGASG